MPISSLHKGDEFYRALLDDFVIGLTERVKEIEVASRRTDVTEMRRLARKLRGSAAVYGFPQLAAALQKLDQDQFDFLELSALCDGIKLAHN